MPEHLPCRSCGAPLLWARTAATGSLIPLNAEPDPTGNVILIDGVAHVKRGDSLEEMVTGPLYMPHHATCPQAEKFRKGAKK